jgi:protein farnesyltransferase/geranylgeranyltransferase type-1 subunit alpha
MEELNFMDEFSSENPKNYQIWYHRRAVVEMLGDGSRELDFTAEVFEVDAKNYHAWAHR